MGIRTTQKIKVVRQTTKKSQIVTIQQSETSALSAPKRAAIQMIKGTLSSPISKFDDSYSEQEVFMEFPCEEKTIDLIRESLAKRTKTIHAENDFAQTENQEIPIYIRTHENNTNLELWNTTNTKKHAIVSFSTTPPTIWISVASPSKKEWQNFAPYLLKYLEMIISQ